MELEEILKTKLIIELPIEAFEKKYIVIKLKSKFETAFEYPIISTPIEDGQFEYSLPPTVKKSDVLEIQFNDTPDYIKKLEVKSEKMGLLDPIPQRFVPPKGRKYQPKDNFEELQNDDTKEVTEDFSDSKILDK